MLPFRDDPPSEVAGPFVRVFAASRSFHRASGAGIEESRGAEDDAPAGATMQNGD